MDNTKLLTKFKVKDVENEMIVNATSAISALQEFVIYNYGGVYYQGSVSIEKLPAEKE